MKSLINLTTLIIFIPFISGCVHNSTAPGKLEQIKEKKSIEISTQKPNQFLPIWYVKEYQSNEESFYSKGVGETKEEAIENALESVKESMKSSLSNAIRKNSRRNRVLKSGTSRIERDTVALIEHIKITRYKVFKTSRLRDTNEVAVLLAVDRKETAKSLKERFIKKLVPIEQRWQKSKKATTLERYIIAKDSYREMAKLIPIYIVADFISPFSKKVKRRVEPTLSYFRQKGVKMRKKLRFCIVKSSSPAVKLFTEEVEYRLKKDGFAIEKRIEGRDTICITLKPNLKHKKFSNRYIISGTVKLLLHPPYSEPIRVEKYKVYGESEVSGKKALENSAKMLQKLLEKEFLKTI